MTFFNLVDLIIPHCIQVYQGWIFISGNFYFYFDSTSLTYISIPKNKRKTKITGDKKLTTTYI